MVKLATNVTDPIGDLPERRPFVPALADQRDRRLVDQEVVDGEEEAHP